MTRTEQARAFINSKKGQWPELCRQLQLGYEWMGKFSRGHIKYPSAEKVDAIIEFARREREERVF